MEILCVDIMIGNWVMFENTTHVVTEISETLIATRWIEGNDKYIHTLSDLCPIPLTEDILLKAGFDKLEPNVDKITQEEINEGKLITVTIYRLFPITFNTSNGWWLYNKHMDNPPKYFHQLQNLFFILSGNQLIINI